MFISFHGFHVSCFLLFLCQFYINRPLKQVLFGGREPENGTHHRQILPSRLISYYASYYSVCVCVYFRVIYKLVETISKGFINGPLARKALPASSMARNGR